MFFRARFGSGITLTRLDCKIFLLATGEYFPFASSKISLTVTRIILDANGILLSASGKSTFEASEYPIAASENFFQ